MRWVVLLGFFLVALAYEENEKAGTSDSHSKTVKEEIEESHDDSPMEEEVVEQTDEHESHQPFFNFPGFPQIYPFFPPPPWMNFFNPRPMPFMPSAHPERYLKAMDEDEYDDDLLSAEAHHRAEAFARAEAHARAEALAHAEASEKKHRRRRSLYGNPNGELVDTFEVQHADEFWQDIDGGEPNKVTEMFMSRPGYAAKQAIKKQLDHYAFPLHMGFIDTGRLPHPELSPPSDRAFGKDFDFNEEDLESFRYQPKGGRFLDDEDFIKLYESGYQPDGKKYVIHKDAFTKDTECRVLKQSLFKNKKYWETVSCKEMYTPGVYRLVKIDYDEGDMYLYFREAALGGKYWAICDINPMGIQAYSPLLEKIKTEKEYH